MIFYVLNSQTLNWTLADSTQTAIADATVTATLYSGRDLNNPGTTPGTGVSSFTALSLAYVSNGLYAVAISPLFNPPVGGGYVLVVDAVRPSGAKAHWEVPSVVAPRQD